MGQDTLSDFRLPTLAAQRSGVDVLAAADGRLLRARDGMATGDGLSATASGFTFVPSAKTVAAGKAGPFTFQIRGSGATPVTGPAFAPQIGVPNSANSNFTYSPRQLQLGVRVKF